MNRFLSIRARSSTTLSFPRQVHRGGIVLSQRLFSSDKNVEGAQIDQTLAIIRARSRLRLSDAHARKISGIGPVAALEYVTKNKLLEANEGQVQMANAFQELQDGVTQARSACEQWRKDNARARLELEKSINSKTHVSAGSTKHTPTLDGELCFLTVGPPPRFRPAGAFVFGPVGGGKTTIMDLFFLSMQDNCAGQERRMRAHCHEFMYELHTNMHKLRKTMDPDYLLEAVVTEIAKKTDIICFDEFAITNVADSIIMKTLLQLLFQLEVAVVATSNRPPEDLYLEGLNRQVYIPKLIDVMRTDMLVRELAPGKDFRESMMEEQKIEVNDYPFYFTPIGTPANDKLETFFSRAVDGIGDIKPYSLPVSWNRTIQVDREANGVGVFNFKNLCEAPVSPDDFIYIARRYHTVFLCDIPILRVDDHNEARRLTNLVDVLYENSVKLICTADGPIDDVLKEVQALCATSEEEASTKSIDLGFFTRTGGSSETMPGTAIVHMERMRNQQVGSRYKADEKRSIFDQASAKESRKSGHLSPAPTGRAEKGPSLATQKWADKNQRDLQAREASREGVAAPAGSDYSASQEGVGGVMISAVGSLQESGFAARRAISRVKEMQTDVYNQAHVLRKERIDSEWATGTTGGDPHQHRL